LVYRIGIDGYTRGNEDGDSDQTASVHSSPG
jgi:hypothetical protein